MKVSVIVRSLPLLLSFSLLVAATAPGCTRPYVYDCTIPGETIWLCTFSVNVEACDCTMEQEQTEWACASNYTMALEQAESLIDARLGVGATYRPITCMDTHNSRPQALEPDLTVQRFCDAAPVDDDCAACAKTSCCDEFSACTGDPRCACWVDCLSDGNAVSVCALPEHCGPAEGVATATAACLDNACQTQCPSLGSLDVASTYRPPGAAKAPAREVSALEAPRSAEGRRRTPVPSWLLAVANA